MKKLSFLPLLALLVFVLSACTPTQKDDTVATGDDSNTVKNEVSEPSEPSQPTNTADTAGVELASCLDSCKIIKEDTGLISKATCHVGCYMNEATAKKDPSICTANVSDALMLPACLTAVAEEMKDITVCDKIGADMNDLMRGSCYTTVVEKTKDATPCEAIKNSMMYSGCVEGAAQQ